MRQDVPAVVADEVVGLRRDGRGNDRCVLRLDGLGNLDNQTLGLIHDCLVEQTTEELKQREGSGDFTPKLRCVSSRTNELTSSTSLLANPRLIRSRADPVKEMAAAISTLESRKTRSVLLPPELAICSRTNASRTSAPESISSSRV